MMRSPRESSPDLRVPGRVHRVRRAPGHERDLVARADGGRADRRERPSAVRDSHRHLPADVQRESGRDRPPRPRPSVARPGPSPDPALPRRSPARGLRIGPRRGHPHDGQRPGDRSPGGPFDDRGDGSRRLGYRGRLPMALRHRLFRLWSDQAGVQPDLPEALRRPLSGVAHRSHVWIPALSHRHRPGHRVAGGEALVPLRGAGEAPPPRMPGHRGARDLGTAARGRVPQHAVRVCRLLPDRAHRAAPAASRAPAPGAPAR